MVKSNRKANNMNEQEVNEVKTIMKWIGIVIIGVIGLILVFGSWFTIMPYERGILVTLGKADSDYKSEGFHLKSPFISSVVKIGITQLTYRTHAPCFSSDLQQVNVNVVTMFRIPEANVIKLYKEYNVNIYEAYVQPKMQEALKEVTALRTAEQIVKTREEVKQFALKSLREKVGDLVKIDDIVIENIDLSKELETAIEQKMVQEQQAQKAKFMQQQAIIDAQTAKIRAEGEANMIRIRAEALQQNPRIIELTFIEKWDGHLPQMLGGNQSILNTLK